MGLEIKKLSSLTKIINEEIYGEGICALQGFIGQELSFQLVLEGEGEYEISVCSSFADKIKLYRVQSVFAGLPAYKDWRDENYLATEPCDIYDPLIPICDGKIVVEGGKKSVLWVSVCTDRDCVGQSDVSICFENGDEIVNADVALRVYPFELPKQELIFTQWFHTDCIADFHGVEVFSDKHWELIESYMSVACEHGMNMILTPVLTPPLDTEVGGERTTVQLAEISLEDGEYKIDLSRLEKFIDIATGCGFSYFEINHMFTQWGAGHAPKVMARVGGEYKRIFGWETEATSQEYASFLRALIPEIIKTFEKKGIDKSRLFFHVSDEPGRDHLDAYRGAGAILSPLVEGARQVDALSNLDFYEQGLVKTPIVAIDRIEPFVEAEVDGLWCYYCCAQNKEVANRFMAMPSARSRIIGTQMYLYDIEGFLQWGYNFYNTQYSKSKINPYQVTDAGGAFPSGDAFSAYPCGDGATPSLRMKVFKNAIEDMRLLKLLESKIGKESTHSLVKRVAGMDITFKKYPKDDDFFDRLYDAIYAELSK